MGFLSGSESDEYLMAVHKNIVLKYGVLVGLFFVKKVFLSNLKLKFVSLQRPLQVIKEDEVDGEEEVEEEDREEEEKDGDNDVKEEEEEEEADVEIKPISPIHSPPEVNVSIRILFCF